MLNEKEIDELLDGSSKIAYVQFPRLSGDGWEIKTTPSEVKAFDGIWSRTTSIDWDKEPEKAYPLETIAEMIRKKDRMRISILASEAYHRERSFLLHDQPEKTFSGIRMVTVLSVIGAKTTESDGQLSNRVMLYGDITLNTHKVDPKAQATDLGIIDENDFYIAIVQSLAGESQNAINVDVVTKLA